MRSKQFLPLIGLLFASALMAQHGRYLNESKHPAIGDPKAVAAGAKLWAQSCSGCHGPDGSGGRGPNLVKRQVWHPLSDETIHNTILNGVPGTDMPPTKLSEDDTWNLVAFVKAQIGPASENNVPGDPEAGRAVYWGAKAGCSGCHSIRGEGGRLGPDLTDIGGSRPLVVIKDAVVDPTKGAYATHAGGGLGQPHLFGAEPVTVKLKNGKQIQGVARNRNNYSMQVIDSKGDVHLISMLDVDTLTIATKSVMPSDYGQRLSKQEITDLLAYLSRQTVRPTAAAARGTR